MLPLIFATQTNAASIGFSNLLTPVHGYRAGGSAGTITLNRISGVATSFTYSTGIAGAGLTLQYYTGGDTVCATTPNLPVGPSMLFPTPITFNLPQTFNINGTGINAISGGTATSFQLYFSGAIADNGCQPLTPETPNCYAVSCSGGVCTNTGNSGSTTINVTC